MHMLARTIHEPPAENASWIARRKARDRVHCRGNSTLAGRLHALIQATTPHWTIAVTDGPPSVLDEVLAFDRKFFMVAAAHCCHNQPRGHPVLTGSWPQADNREQHETCPHEPGLTALHDARVVVVRVRQQLLHRERVRLVIDEPRRRAVSRGSDVCLGFAGEDRILLRHSKRGTRTQPPGAGTGLTVLHGSRRSLEPRDRQGRLRHPGPRGVRRAGADSRIGGGADSCPSSSNGSSRTTPGISCRRPARAARPTAHLTSGS